MPKFCKKYARVGLHINDGLEEGGAFPGEDYSPYKMSEEEEESMCDELLQRPREEPDAAEQDGMASRARRTGF